jgi:hypothetical protein
MIIEIGREIGEAEAFVVVALSAPQRPPRDGIFVLHKNRRAGELIAAGTRQRDVLERLDDSSARL